MGVDFRQSDRHDAQLSDGDSVAGAVEEKGELK
jgi:hypothetical protein